MKNLSRLFILLSLAASSLAQSPTAHVGFDDAAKMFRMDSAHVSYVLGVDREGYLETVYWGERLGDADKFPLLEGSKGWHGFDPPITTTPHEFMGWGGGSLLEPDLKVTFPDGNRDLVLKYVSNSIAGDRLNITMKDIQRDVLVILHYRMDPETGILRRSATVENHTPADILIEQIAAGTYNLPRGTDYHLHFLTGGWAREWTLQDQPIRSSKITLESRRGTTGSQNNPWFAINKDESKDEDQGDTYFGALAWSGSWQISIEQDALQQVHITGGMNAFDFSYHLKKDSRFETPEFDAGFSHQGLGGASRLMHRFEMNSVVPNAPNERLRPVLYNSWEATAFNLNEEGQVALAEKAASIGAERFVMDDGWFGARNNDHAGLGDWEVNRQKFPNGLKPLIDKVHSLGMQFGIWVEPEMVNADSDLYRKHPDWVLNFTGRPRSERHNRHQMVLNLARPDVRAYVMGVLNKLLDENQIDFLKWDYNRNWSEPGWPAVPIADQKNVYYDFTMNYYSVLAEMKAKHPKVELETCSGGGGRVDLGVLRYADQAWPSDNTDPYDRLTIQNGFSYAYSPGLMMAWVTDSPTWVNNRTVSLEYRFLSSMQGSLGIGVNLNKFSPEEFAESKKFIEEYKTIRETVQRGSLYRLILPTEGSEASATEYVARDGKQTVLFAFLHSSTEYYPYPTIKLRGLDSAATYTITSLNGKVSADTPHEASGAYWMGHGVDILLVGDFQAAAVKLDKQ